MFTPTTGPWKGQTLLATSEWMQFSLKKAKKWKMRAGPQSSNVNWEITTLSGFHDWGGEESFCPEMRSLHPGVTVSTKGGLVCQVLMQGQAQNVLNVGACTIEWQPFSVGRFSASDPSQFLPTFTVLSKSHSFPQASLKLFLSGSKPPRYRWAP